MNDYNWHYIDGEMVQGESEESFEVRDSTTEAVIGAVPAASSAEVDRAVRAAHRAFGTWSTLTIDARAAYLDELSRRLLARVPELSRLASQEVGTVRRAADAVAQTAATSFGTNAAIAREWSWDSPLSRGTTVVNEPIGVVAAIVPWNIPLLMAALKVAPALAAGCTMVLKPSEVAPLTNSILAEVAHEVGLPPGVLNIVHGDGNGAGEAMVGHPLVDMVSFTGSTRAGRRISAVAGETIKRVVLELGGKSPCLVLDDADLESAVMAAMGSITSNNGQSCSALSRILVPRARLDEAEQIAVAFLEKCVVGDPLDDATTVGPVASAVHRDRVVGYIQSGIADGARLITGGPDRPEHLPRGYFVTPTVFSCEDPSMRIAVEEIFGPVQVIVPYDDEAQAIEIANATSYGLAAAVFSDDLDRADRTARAIRAGLVNVNCTRWNPDAPFGGYKQSGNGRTWGTHGFAEYLETKSLIRD